MTPVYSVRRLLYALLAGSAITIILVGATGVIGVLSTTRAVDYLSQDLGPAVTANSAVLQDMTDAETGVRGFAGSGNPAALGPYHNARRRLPVHEQALSALVGSHPTLPALVRRQQQLTESWFAKYGEVRIANAGRGTFRPRVFARGQEIFDDFRRVNSRIGLYLTHEANAARLNAQHRLAWTVGLIGVASLAAMVLGLLVGRWVIEQVRRPLRELENTVNRLAGGDDSARAPVTGPREVRRVALSLNELADESQRSRAMEAQIVQRLREVDTAKADFVSNVSHELRTPLTIINGYIELFEEEFEDTFSGQQDNMLAVTKRNVVRLRELIEDLLTLSQAENRETEFQTVDLRQIVRDVMSDLRFAAAGREVRLEASTPDEPQPVLADPSQLHRALLNVASNAVKFSGAGGTVRIAVAPDGDDTTLEVVDEGIGIPATDLPGLGNRFFRASNAVEGQIAGTGLGLRIVQTILDHHGGSMRIESVEGQGTTVRIRLPLRNEPELRAVGSSGGD